MKMIQQKQLTFCCLKILAQCTRQFKGVGRFKGQKLLLNSPPFLRIQVSRTFSCTGSLRTNDSKSESTKDKGYSIEEDSELKEYLKTLRQDFNEDNLNQSKKVTTEKETEAKEKESTKSTPLSGRYEAYSEDKAEVIYDMLEEEQRYEYKEEDPEPFTKDEFQGIDLERGVTGVFEVESLHSLLLQENALDIVVLKLEGNEDYAQHIFICSTKSHKHTAALAQFIKKVYKRKKHTADPMCDVSVNAMPTAKRMRKLQYKGRTWEIPKDWAVLNLGNIVLHLMSSACRKEYDLESLWALGPEFDSKCLEEEDDLVEELLKKHTFSVKDFEPLLG